MLEEVAGSNFESSAEEFTGQGMASKYSFLFYAKFPLASMVFFSSTTVSFANFSLDFACHKIFANVG